MGSNHRGRYTHDWPDVARAVKAAAGWRCVRCGHPHETARRPVDCDDACDLARHPEWTPAVIGTVARAAVRYDANGRPWILTGRRRQRVLTVAHLDDDKSNNAWWNLAALCQVCHLSTQSRIEMHRPWVLTEHSAWFRKYVAGFYALKYLGESLTEEDVIERLDDLLELERRALAVTL